MKTLLKQLTAELAVGTAMGVVFAIIVYYGLATSPLYGDCGRADIMCILEGFK